ncbi:flagellar hook-basal body protein [Mesobacillus jeotgali]|jgi:flagellar basal-body rod protein FlgG|uniref:Flagellar hook-basal body protein n=1 Tax=Mesobacillus jeotgali TaxID=129985 RepID=A0ABY9VFQ7_9BACI|nr:flagellar hook-basal body protein [Mesobacillus jeotgali]WNF22759.1 flagellar hook-basal body protein [Mesobacillus jeotgali]
MNRTMITATNTLSQLQKQMDMISHNLANIDTAGYKRREASFTDLLVQEYRNQPNNALEPQNRMTPFNIRQGTGARLGQIQMILSQGSLKSTGRDLDTAFTAEGQFYRVMVQNEDGSSAMRLTRNGSLYLSPLSDTESMLVNSDGHAILDENGQPITITGNVKNIKINDKGLFIAEMYDGTSREVNLGVILINKPQFLEQKGANLLGLPDNLAELGVTEEEVMTNLTGPLRNQIAIQQGVLEQSNVDMSKEMTDLINVQRSYQFHSKSITLADQMLGLVNGIR